MIPKRSEAMTALALTSAALFFLPACVQAAHHPQGEAHAGADIIDGQGQGTGLATLIQHPDGIHVEVAAERLSAGVHAVHIHEVGTCTGPDFASAGGHWNPADKQHGHENPAGAHMGDLPNMTVGANGKGVINAVIKGAMIKGGTDPLLDADGAAVVIHASADDYRTDPTGNAGGRLACGVIQAK